MDALARESCFSYVRQSRNGVEIGRQQPFFENLVKSLIPRSTSSADNEIMPNISQKNKVPGHEFLELTMYLASNNFLLHRSRASVRLYEWLRSCLNKDSLGYILSIRSPTIEAMTERSFSLLSIPKTLIQ